MAGGGARDAITGGEGGASGARDAITGTEDKAVRRSAFFMRENPLNLISLATAFRAGSLFERIANE